MKFEFEVGKQYKGLSGNLYNCLFVCPQGRLVLQYVDHGQEIIYGISPNSMIQQEYIELQRGILFLNIYPIGFGGINVHHTREKADRGASRNRIACVKVPWVEGQGLTICKCRGLICKCKGVDPNYTGPGSHG